MQVFEEIEISTDVFEPSSNSSRLIVPLMEEYPSPKNTFDIFLGNDGSTRTDVFSNTEGKDIPWADIAQGIGVVTGSVLANRDENKKMLRLRCGRRPLFRKNREEYNECSERFGRELQGLDSDSGNSLTNEQFLALFEKSQKNDKKGIGVAGVIGIVLGVVAVGTAIYFISRKK